MRSFAMLSAILSLAGCAGVIQSESIATSGREYHVAAQGLDTNDGSSASPFKTISAAAQSAQPGDVITVHRGIYRERINPPRGGASETKRIVYQAAPGEKAVIKGSEPMKGWTQVEGDTWKVVIPNSLFGHFNPYSDLISGDWFTRKGRNHHTGAVYLYGNWLTEAAKLDEALKPAGKNPLWFGQVDGSNTTIWAQFKGVNPNEAEVEINVRQTVFYPDKPGRNYITVRGFTLEHAATPWAPPTAEQMGLIGTHWSKGWIIENNVIRYSTCSGVALGKYGDRWDNRAESAEGYVGTLTRALTNGWSKAAVGSHIVRNNEISHCEQTGIVGSLGCSFSTVTGNTIHDIHVRRLFSGAEMAGIKFHGAIDVEIAGNHIYRTCRGIWLDWMAQGTHVTRNLLHDNGPREDLFVEVNHGPFMVDNNIFLSPIAMLVNSQGGAYIHNLMTGRVSVIHNETRQTPYHKAHSTEVVGLHGNPSGDDRYFNNLMADRSSLTPYDPARLPVFMGGNVFLAGAQPSSHESNPLVQPDMKPEIQLIEKPDGFYLGFTFDESWQAGQTRKLVTTGMLGKAKIPDLPYEHPDGSPCSINTDYFEKTRNEQNPFPGPFELPGAGKQMVKVWPVPARK